MRTLHLLSCLMLLAMSSGSFAKDTLNAPAVFKLNVKVKTSLHELAGLTVHLYDHNTLVQTISPNKKGSFKARLERNKYYTLEFSMPGYYSKRIAFSTYVADDIVNESVFKFDVYMIANDELKGVDASTLDFPVALVSYDKKARELSYDKRYTEKVSFEHERLLFEAQLRKRYAMLN